MKRETEAKCAVPDVLAVAVRLAGVGRQAVPWGFETNELWDFPDARLRAAGSLLRLRQAGGVALLTFKAPAAGQPGLKTMAEAETAVADPAALRAILQGVGLASGWRYEKFRSVWQVETPAGQAGVCLDIVPCGQFVEVEGAPAAIAAVFELLHLRPGPEASRTYRDLFQHWQAEQGLPPEAPMSFAPDEAAAWAARLGIQGSPAQTLNFSLKDTQP